MTKVEACNASDLSIHLDSHQSFLPGQIITGYVSRTSRWVSTDTNISITLHGKCNTEFFCPDSYLCRSSLELFGQDGIRKELFNGALHIQTTSLLDDNKWRFAIDIPRHPDSRFLKSHPLGRASYLPLLHADQHSLPPSFDLGSSNDAVSRRGSAVVECYLEAVMTTPSSSKPVVARIPVHIRCESSPFPITDFDIKIHSRQSYTITSPRLNPAGIETTKAFMGQRIGKMLGLSRAGPRLTFCLEISVPSVLQKGSPYQVPFEMRAVPQWTDTSDCIANFPQTIYIKGLTIAVRSTSSIMGIASGAVSPVPAVREDQFVTKIILADYTKPKSVNQIDVQGTSSKTLLGEHSSSNDDPLTLPIGEKTTPLNIGQLLDVKLRDDQFQIDVPTFITYNIKRTYELEWKMSLEIGGEMLKVKGRHPVLIMERTDQD